MIPKKPMLVLAALAALSLACAKEKQATSVPAGASGGLSPSTVVATFDNQKITAGQLDAEISQKLYELRRQELERMVMQRLVKAEAAKKGMTEEQWLTSEVDAKVKPPSDEEIKKFFEENQKMLPPGATLEQLRPQIASVMAANAKRAKAAEILDGLRKQANVQILLEEPKIAVDATGPSRGPANAKVTIIEFSDFQCPFCKRAKDTVDKVMEAYAGKVRLVFRQYPLSFHPQAQKAAEASLCAADQGKFWEFHDLLFSQQDKLQISDLKEHAKAVGLDAAKFDSCLDSGAKADAVKVDVTAGQGAGVEGTPAFFINGRFLNGARPEEEFRRVIDQELAKS